MSDWGYFRSAFKMVNTSKEDMYTHWKMAVWADNVNTNVVRISGVTKDKYWNCYTVDYPFSVRNIT